MLVVIMMLAMSTAALAAGTNSITVSGAKAGETYNIYKMLDLAVHENAETTGDTDAYDGFNYTINTKWSTFWTKGAGKEYIDTNTVGSNTYVVWKADKQDAGNMEAFGKAAAAWAADNNISADASDVTVAESGTTAVFNNLENGYYMITSTYGTAVTVGSTPNNADQTIQEKNTENTTEKLVQEAAEGNGTAASWGTSNDAAVGDTVTFRSKVVIAKNSINVVYHDTMTAGLTWDGVDATKVYTDEACTTELTASCYTVTAGTGEETFTVSFNNDYVYTLTAATTTLYIKYTAVLNDKAVVDTSDTNTGKVTWGDAGKSTETTTTTDTRKFQILKYDGTDSDKNPLANAKFQIFTSEEGTTPVTLAVNAAGTIYRVVSDSTDLPEGYTLATENKIVTLASQKITVEGVDSDDYWLEETDAPTGYNKLTERVKVEVSVDNTLSSEIENLSGTELPSTGGIGTTIFYIIGAILVVGAGVILITRKRMGSAK